MQKKIYGNRQTNRIKITLANSSNVQAEGHCKINSIETIETSRMVITSTQSVEKKKDAIGKVVDPCKYEIIKNILYIHLLIENKKQYLFTNSNYLKPFL